MASWRVVAWLVIDPEVRTGSYQVRWGAQDLHRGLRTDELKYGKWGRLWPGGKAADGSCGRDERKEGVPLKNILGIISFFQWHPVAPRRRNQSSIRLPSRDAISDEILERTWAIRARAVLHRDNEIT